MVAWARGQQWKTELANVRKAFGTVSRTKKTHNIQQLLLLLLFLELLLPRPADENPTDELLAPWGLNEPAICSILCVLFCFVNFLNVYLFLKERETEHDRGRGRERGRHRIRNRLQPSAQSLTWGSNSRTARSWPGWSRTLNRLRHPGAPKRTFLKKEKKTA